MGNNRKSIPITISLSEEANALLNTMIDGMSKKLKYKVSKSAFINSLIVNMWMEATEEAKKDESKENKEVM